MTDKIDLENIGIDWICGRKYSKVITCKYKIDNIKSLYKERKCGAYVIVRENGERYVGSSRDVYNRIRCHIYKNDSPIIDIYILLVEDYNKAIILEKYLYQNIDCINKKEPMYCR